MRLSSGFSKVSITLLLAQSLSCSSTIPGYVRNDTSVFKGAISVKENTPFDRKIMLVSGKDQVLRLRPGRLEGELYMLAGHSVEVTGTIRTGNLDDRVIVVNEYRLLPVNGMVPVKGMIKVVDGRVLFDDRKSGKDYILTGPLEGALSSFDGMSAWVWGIVLDNTGEALSVPGAGTPAASMIEVKGYAVVGPSRD